MILADLLPLANHLWQSTLCVCVAWLLTLSLRRNRAAVRYWIWLAASVKFLIPFCLLVSVGRELGSRTVPASEQPHFSFVMEEISRPFDLSVPVVSPVSAPRTSDPVPAILFGVWLFGFAIAVISWLRWWRRIRVAQSIATPLHLKVPIRVMSSPVRLEPGVFGICKPVLLLPEGISDHLPAAQLEAIVTHELCHVRRRDNLTAAIHMIVEAIFWFYPLVWWMRARLVEERELACDQDVLRTSCEPRIYAEGILNVCKFYLASPLVCLSGVTGSGLKKRIEAIVANRIPDRLSSGHRFMLAVAAIAAVASPAVVGIESGSPGRAQSFSGSHAAAFEVASIRPDAIWKTGGETRSRSKIEFSPDSLTMRNVDLSECVQWAYGIQFYQISGQNSVNAERYDILAKAEGPAPVSQLRVMLQDLLAKRFNLALHRETKILRVYELVAAKSGPKLPAPKTDAEVTALHASESLPRVEDGNFVFLDTSMPQFAEKLSHLRGIDYPVVDTTGVKGVFDIILKSGASAMLEPDGPSLFTLLQEQLGLKLVSAKAPIEVLVIDHAEKPSEN